MDIDLPRHRVLIRQEVSQVGSEATVKHAATSEHGCRAIDIGPTFATVIKAREKQQLDERVAAGRSWEDIDLACAHPTWGPRGVPPGRWWYTDHVSRLTSPSAVGRAAARPGARTANGCRQRTCRASDGEWCWCGTSATGTARAIMSGQLVDQDLSVDRGVAPEVDRPQCRRSLQPRSTGHDGSVHPSPFTWTPATIGAS